MWKRLRKLSLFAILSLTVLQGQTGTPQACKSSRTMHGPCDDCVSGLQEGLLDIDDAVGKSDGTALFRICSDEPLPVAMLVADRNPVALGKILMMYYPEFNGDRIAIARSPSCHRYLPRFTPVELWAVPKGAEFPDFAERTTLSQIQMKQYNQAEKQTTALQGHDAQQLINDLKQRPNAIGVIRAFYNSRSKSAMRRNVEIVAKMLIGNGISKDRIFIRFVPAPTLLGVHGSAEKYPDIFSVEITSNAATTSNGN